MKKVLAIALSLILLLGLLPAASLAAGTDVSIAATVSEAEPGDSFTVTLTVPAVAKLVADAQFKVSFNNTLFEVTSFVPPTFANSQMTASDVDSANTAGAISCSYQSTTYDNTIDLTAGTTITATFAVKDGVSGSGDFVPTIADADWYNEQTFDTENQLTIPVGAKASVTVPAPTYGINCVAHNLSGNESAGTVSLVTDLGSWNGASAFGSATENTSVSINAVANAGYEFVAWRLSVPSDPEALFSASASHSFDAAATVWLYAVFQETAAETWSVHISSGNVNGQASFSADQNVTGGQAMTPIVLTANDGWYFPNPLTGTVSSNGVTAAWNSYGQVTVSGTPTANVSLTFGPSAKTKEATPDAAYFVATDADAGVLYGLEDGVSYSVTGAATLDFTASGSSQALTGVTAGTLSIVRKASSEIKLDSDAKEYSVMVAGTAPSLSHADCTDANNNNGKIYAVIDGLEWKASADNAWTPGTGADAEGLTPGTYNVRYKAHDNILAGPTATIVIAAYETPALAGTVAITGTAKFLETLTADVSGITNNTGTLHYTWKRGSVATGTDSPTYFIGSVVDIGSTITLTVTSDAESGSLVSAATAAVAKADGQDAPVLTPVAPTVAGGSDGKIQNTSNKMEYATAMDFSDAAKCPYGTELTGLTAGTYYVRYAETSTTLAGAIATVVVPDGAAPTYAISLDKSGTHYFDNQQVGYAAVTPLTVTVSNTGNMPTGALTVALYGENASSFTLSAAAVADIAPGGTGSFTVAPNTGLAAGVYTAQVLVTGGNNLQGSFNLQMTVSAAPTHVLSISQTGSYVFPTANAGYAPVTPLTVTLDSTGTGDTGTLSISLTGANPGYFLLSKDSVASIASGDSDSFTVTPDNGIAAGTYTATVVVSGSYDIYKLFGVSFTVIGDLGGTVAVNGTAKLGATLTADASGVTGNTGTLAYQWKRSGAAIAGATGSSYTLTAADIGAAITVTVTSSVETGSVTSAATAAVEKADGPAAPVVTPVAPSVAGGSDGAITGTTNEMEYAAAADFSDAAAISGSSVTGLTAGTYYVRFAETATVKASAAAAVVIPDGAAPTYSIAVDKSAIYPFVGAVEGYAALAPASVTVTNTGTAATGGLTVALTGADAGSFTLSKTALADIAPGGTDSFTVVPVTGLAVGGYTATVTVSGGNSLSASFDVSFTVFAEGGYVPAPTYAVSAAGADHGAISVSPAQAEAGETVTVTVTPDPGYALESLTAASAAVTRVSDSVYTFVMPDGAVTVRAAFEARPFFTDVTPDAWYYDAVCYCAAKGYVSGTGDGLYSPEDGMTRAMFVTLLYHIAQEPAVSGAMPFTDVAEGEWFSDAIRWAAAEGFIDGDGQGFFDPEGLVTREQMAVLLWRYLKAPAGDADLSVFTDAGDVSDYAREALDWAVGAGIVNGNGDGTLNPGGTATRAEVAQLICNWETKTK